MPSTPTKTSSASVSSSVGVLSGKLSQGPISPSTPKRSPTRRLLRSKSPIPPKSPNTPKSPAPSGYQYKTKIASRLDAAVREYKPRNRSADLVPLNRDYDVMRKRLRALINSTESFMHNMLALDQSRMEVFGCLSKLAEESPLQDRMGKDQPRGRASESQTTTGTPSLLSLNQKLSDIEVGYAKAYENSVVNYAKEWELVVTKRVDAELAVTSQYHKRLNHYQTKVDGLRRKVNDKETKGKGAPSQKLTDKLSRNESKLENSWKTHEKAASKLCDLLEEVTRRGWKDLFPLVAAIMNWRTSLDVESRVKVMNQFEGVFDHLASDFSRSNSVSLENAPKAPPIAGAATYTSADGSATKNEKIEVAAAGEPEYVVNGEVDDDDDEDLSDTTEDVEEKSSTTIESGREEDVFVIPAHA